MDTYANVHAGDIILGHDGNLWGVQAIAHSPQVAVTLVRDEGRVRVTGWPPAGTLVTVVARADLTAEAMAAQIFIDAGLVVDIVSESLGR